MPTSIKQLGAIARNVERETATTQREREKKRKQIQEIALCVYTFTSKIIRWTRCWWERGFFHQRRTKTPSKPQELNNSLTPKKKPQRRNGRWWGKRKESSVLLWFDGRQGEEEEEEEEKEKASTVDNGVPVCDTLAWSSGRHRVFKWRERCAQRATRRREKKNRSSATKKNKKTKTGGPMGASNKQTGAHGWPASELYTQCNII